MRCGAITATTIGFWRIGAANQSHQNRLEPDYEVIQGIVDYFLTYPSQYPHPKEDLVFRRLEEPPRRPLR